MRGHHGRTWHGVIGILAGAAAFFLTVVGIIYFKDPYGRAGIRPSFQVPNVGERELLVSRAMDPQFNSAIVGSSTSIPLQPEILDPLTGRRFVSLAISGSGPQVALAVSRFFLAAHSQASSIIVALDDAWCWDGTEGRPFPSWLWGDKVDYAMGLFANASWDLFRTAVFQERGGNRLDGFHPYDDVFRLRDFDDMDFLLKRLNRTQRPTQARFMPPFAPPKWLFELIDRHPSVQFVLFWTPRYISIIPVAGTSAAEADGACKRQVADSAAARANAVVVDWSMDRAENRDPTNFFDPNHYRDSVARQAERDIASAYQNLK